MVNFIHLTLDWRDFCTKKVHRNIFGSFFQAFKFKSKKPLLFDFIVPAHSLGWTEMLLDTSMYLLKNRGNCSLSLMAEIWRTTQLAYKAVNNLGISYSTQLVQDFRAVKSDVSLASPPTPRLTYPSPPQK